MTLTGTSDTDSGAELNNEVPIPESVWAGSDDALNAQWRELSSAETLIDWDTDYGMRVQLACFEKDFDVGGSSNFTVNGDTDIFGQTVNFSFTYGFPSGTDECGQFALLVRTSTGDWTRIPDIRNGESDGTAELEWAGYGMPL